MNRRLVPFLLLLGVLIFGLVFVLVRYWPAPQQKPKVQTTTNPTYKTVQIGLTLVSTGFSLPTDIVSSNSTSDTRLFIAERAGVIRILNSNGKLEQTSLLDIHDKVQSDGEMGLLGLAFHPNYSKNGYFYVNYIDKARNTVIARFQANLVSNFSDPATEKQLLKIPQPYPNHNGGQLQFGPDGFLYIGLGDGGSGGDPENRAQNPNELLGKILRLDVNNGDPYSVPKSNPFVNKSGYKGEIWDLGLRNPWRFSFDRQTKELWIADVGQGKIEEIDLEKASSGGVNYGWRCYEGSNQFNASNCLDKADYAFPIAEYDHSQERCSVTGGYVYRGKESPALAGKYFYGDFCTGEVFSAAKIGDNWQTKLEAASPYKISTFGQGSNGELYLADFATGSIYKLEDLGN